MPFEVVCRGVLQVGGQGLSGPGDCCVYMLETGEGSTVLVDAGLGTDPEGLIQNIEETGHNMEDIVALVLTHCHIDHIGGAPTIVARSGCEVIAHEDDAHAISEGIASRTAAEAYGVPSPKVEITRTIASDGGPLQFGDLHMVVIHTPGHTPGNISLQLSSGGRTLVLANDVHGPFRREWGSDLRAWRRSMNRLIAIGPDMLLEGHFGVIQPRAAVIEFIRGMLDQYGHEL